MSEVLQANIFFITASIATVVFVVLVSVALYHIIKILIAVRTIIERVAEGSDMIAKDVDEVRQFVKSGGLVAYLINLVTPHKSARRRGRERNTDETND